MGRLWLGLWLAGCAGDFPPIPADADAVVGLADATAPDGGCDPIVERCNGLDDDCDGKVDEQQADRPCPAATGLCAGAVSVCDGAAGFTACDPPAHARAEGRAYVAEEDRRHCNGVDDDCDGQVDEACDCRDGETMACGEAEGRCEPGFQQCAEGRWGACNGATGPRPEACDGVDDDCDGRVDEAVANACGACGPEPEELCNGADDDCDGVIDEGAECC